MTTETLATFNPAYGLRRTQEKTGRDACSTLAFYFEPGDLVLKHRRVAYDTLRARFRATSGGNPESDSKILRDLRGLLCRFLGRLPRHERRRVQSIIGSLPNGALAKLGLACVLACPRTFVTEIA